MGLNEHQRRRIEVSLALVDRALLEMERYYLSEKPLTSEMVTFTSDLRPAERQQILRLIEQFRHGLRVVREKFQLTPQEVNLRRLLRSYFSHFWSVLHDCRSTKLRGYGDVDPELAHHLDPEMDRLIALAEELERIILSPRGSADEG
jgi:hypothetical protein